MTRQAKARKHRAHKYGKNTRKPYGTKNRTRDYDQVCEDMKSSEEALKAFTQGDEDEVGGGKWYCVPCARYFIDETVLMRHYKTAPHKKMLKKIQKEKPWTLEDARGMGVDNGKPLGRAPKPIPIAPGEAGNATAATTTTNATQNPPPKTTEGEDITFTF